jgi:hypothetical protein
VFLTFGLLTRLKPGLKWAPQQQLQPLLLQLRLQLRHRNRPDPETRQRLWQLTGTRSTPGNEYMSKCFRKISDRHYCFLVKVLKLWRKSWFHWHLCLKMSLFYPTKVVDMSKKLIISIAVVIWKNLKVNHHRSC